MGIGRASGRARAQDAAAAAISSPLLDFPIEKAKGVVFNIVGGSDLTLQEINAAADVIYQAVDPNANIIFGAMVDETMNSGGEIAITVIATGFPVGTLGADGATEVVKVEPKTVGTAMRQMIREPSEVASMPKAAAATVTKRPPIKAVESASASSTDDDVPDFLARLRRKK